MSNEEAFKSSVDSATLKIIEQLMGNVEQSVLILESEAKKECPVDQGILRASITHDVSLTSESIEGACYSPLEIAPYVHQGTGIYAADGNGRKTPWGYTATAGKYKGFHWTHGQKPNPFLDRARNKSINRIEKKLGGK